MVHAKKVGESNYPDNHGSKHEKGVFVCSTRRRRGCMGVGFQFLFVCYIVQHPCRAPEEQGTICGHGWNAMYVCGVYRINQDYQSSQLLLSSIEGFPDRSSVTRKENAWRMESIRYER